MDKKTIKYFWSFFSHLELENQYIFSRKNNKWTAYKISMNEKKSSGSLNVQQIWSIAEELKDAENYVVHNHPYSYTPEPSNLDRVQYTYLKSMLNLCGAHMTDYLIVSNQGYFSFKEANFIEPNYPTISANRYAPAERIKMPNVSLQVHIEQVQEDMVSLLETYPEMIYSTENQYGTTGCFSPLFLLQHEHHLENRCILFIKELKYQHEWNRIKMLDRLLSPIEIYLVRDETFIPLKLEGII